jgi:hypothetical protein
MPTRVQHKRSTVAGVVPTTSDLALGELGINIPDRKLFTSNGAAVFELGSNLASLSVAGEATFNANVVISNTGELVFAANAGIYANGSLGTAGQVLSSNASSVYWSTVSGSGDVTTTGTQTLTNKRIDPRVSSTASASSVTPDIGSFDMYVYTALAVGLTINATTGGTPVDGNKLVFRFKDDGTARGLTWTTSGTNSFRAIGVTLPTTTTISKVTYVGCIYNSNESFWDVVAVTTQA